MTGRKMVVGVCAVVALLVVSSPWALAQEDVRQEPALAAQAPAAAPQFRRSGPAGWLCCPVPDACPCPKECIDSPLVRIPCIDDCVDKFWAHKFDPATCLKIGAGAYHWWNYDLDNDRLTYGYPDPISIPGTYFYYVTADVNCKPCGCVTAGAHIEARFREHTPIRPFIKETAWLQECYGYLSTPGNGRLKFGKMYQSFGLFWDHSFWENIHYFNGLRINPDWGVSWDHIWKWKRLELPVLAQFFFGEDELNGSFTGGDSESSARFEAEWTAIARVAPKFHVDKNTSVTLGLSGLVGNVTDTLGPDDTRTGFEVDLTVNWCKLEAFAQYAVHDGTVHEAHYVTGGPTDHKAILVAGVQYTYGPFTPRFVYSRGDYKNPGGEESIINIGVEVQLTSILKLYVEYIDWTAQATGFPELQYQDGLQIVLNWNI